MILPGTEGIGDPPLLLALLRRAKGREWRVDLTLTGATPGRLAGASYVSYEQLDYYWGLFLVA